MCRRLLCTAAGPLLALLLAVPASAAVSLTQVGSDPYTNSTSQHATEVEPDTFAFGSTIVSAFQAGRFLDGGGSNVAFATSTDNGATWTGGALSGTTVFAAVPGIYDRVTDPSVAYDVRHNAWLIATLPLTNGKSGPIGPAVIVNRSTDGGLTWGNPVTIATAGAGSDFDKSWIVCDNTSSSPHYGNCYAEWDDFGDGDRIKMSTSTDGGLTWGAAQNTADNATGLGGQPLVQPNGNVIVPAANGFETAIISFRSTNGGASWSSTNTVASAVTHAVAGKLRADALPSAEIDGAGRVYVAWSDCRFRRGCKSNDIVTSNSADGLTWSTPARVPIDNVNSGVDHFIPGLGVDPATSGGTVHLGLAYYYYPKARCSVSNCQLDAGFVSSVDGGATWTPGAQIAGPMTLGQIANTDQGPMVGDYISTSFAGSGTPVTVVAVGKAPTGGAAFDEGMYAVNGLTASSQNFAVTSSGDHPVPNAASDHAGARAPITHH